MRGKVREVEAPAGARDLEELAAEGPAMAGGLAVTAADLGPNGDVVADLLARATGLTPAQARDLEREATWRWGFSGLAATVIGRAGASLPIARAVALARGRAEGRAAAIQVLTAAVATQLHGRSGARSRTILSACVANAGLAVLVRDLIDMETFEVLFGPWREVMHH